MLQTDTASIAYSGNNSIVSPYPVPFRFFYQEDLAIVVTADYVEDPQVLGTDYTVTGADNVSGGNVLFKWAVPLTSRVTISRIIDATQLTSYEEADAFPAKSHEKALDKLTMLVQQLQRQVGTGTGDSDDLASAFRVTTASGALKSLQKVLNSTVGIDDIGNAILRSPSQLLQNLGVVASTWADASARATAKAIFPGQLGVQLSDLTIWVSASTAPGAWLPHPRQNGIVVSMNGVTTAKNVPSGDVVGTIDSQILANKTFNACQINNPTGMTPADVGLGNCDNTSDQNKPVSIPQQAALDTKQSIDVKGLPFGYASLDTTGKVPLAQLPDTALGYTNYLGTWNASTNSPTMTSGTAGGSPGKYRIVSVGGTTNVDGITSWSVGDWIVSDGATWQKIPSTQLVSSVAGRTGAVTLTKADVGLTNVDNTSDVSKNSAAGTLTNKVINGASNTLTVRLGSDVTGNLPINKLNSGIGAAADSWWCGDGTWKKPLGSGDVAGQASGTLNGEVVVYKGTDGKTLDKFTGAVGFAKIGLNSALTSQAKIHYSEVDPDVISGGPDLSMPKGLMEIFARRPSDNTLGKVYAQNITVPFGSIIMFPLSSSWPVGYLICNAGSYLRADYPDLFAVYGGSFGAADGTHFSTPDYRGFVLAGPDAGVGRLPGFNSIYYGAGWHETQLQVAHLPGHVHGIPTYPNSQSDGNWGLARINCGIPCGVGYNGSVMIWGNTGQTTYGAGSWVSHSNIQTTMTVWHMCKAV